MHDSVITFDTEAATLFLDYAKTHREFAELALYEEARIHHLTWADRYEQWAEVCDPHRIDYSAITRAVAVSF